MVVSQNLQVAKAKAEFASTYHFSAPRSYLPTSYLSSPTLLLPETSFTFLFLQMSVGVKSHPQSFPKTFTTALSSRFVTKGQLHPSSPSSHLLEDTAGEGGCRLLAEAVNGGLLLISLAKPAGGCITQQKTVGC